VHWILNLHQSLFFFFCGTVVWTQGIHLEPLHQLFFFKIGSPELFGLIPSWSLPPE
jgi:hypothetical protein